MVAANCFFQNEIRSGHIYAGSGACTYGCRAGKDVRKVVKWVKESI